MFWAVCVTSVTEILMRFGIDGIGFDSSLNLAKKLTIFAWWSLSFLHSVRAHIGGRVADEELMLVVLYTTRDLGRVVSCLVVPAALCGVSERRCADEAFRQVKILGRHHQS